MPCLLLSPCMVNQCEAIQTLSVTSELQIGCEGTNPPRKCKWRAPTNASLYSCALSSLILFYCVLFGSILFCPSTAVSSPPPESSNFLCPLLSLSILFPVALQCHLSNDVLVFRLILRPLYTSLCF